MLVNFQYFVLLIWPQIRCFEDLVHRTVSQFIKGSQNTVSIRFSAEIVNESQFFLVLHNEVLHYLVSQLLWIDFHHVEPQFIFLLPFRLLQGKWAHIFLILIRLKMFQNGILANSVEFVRTARQVVLSVIQLVFF